MMTQAYSKTSIVGGEGFIGRHLARWMKRRNLPVDVVGRSALSELSSEPGLVIWAAGTTSDYAADPIRTLEAHVSDLARVIERGGYEGFVYLSSARLYDGLEGPADEETPLGLDPAEPRHLYDLSKALGEWFVRHRAGPRGRVARLAGVYADGLDGGSFLESMLQQALEGKGGAVATAPDVARDYIHVEDVCEAVWTIAERGCQDLYLVASGERVTNRELFAFLAERTGTEFECSAAPGGQASLPVLHPSRLSDLGFRPKSWAEGLDRVLTWQANQRAMRSMMGVTQMPWM